MDMGTVSIYVEYITNYGNPQLKTYNNVLRHFVGEAGELLIEYYFAKEDKHTTTTVYATGKWSEYRIRYVETNVSM